MSDVLLRMKREAKALLAEHEPPGFYDEYSEEIAYAHSTFFDHPLIIRLREDVIPFIYDDYGFGVDHSKKVAIDAAAIVLHQTRLRGEALARDYALLAMMAGLLHDVCRLESDHAKSAAELAGKLLEGYPLDHEDLERIAFAVRDHENPAPTGGGDDHVARLLADALYDADKFRWGPDHFSTTLWELCEYNEISPAEIVDRFPQGIGKIMEIAPTFRTPEGRKYGAQFVEMGLELGGELHGLLRRILEDETR
ncbi:HD domain-containing protein [Desulfocurvus sp. DL9XJH121]